MSHLLGTRKDWVSRESCFSGLVVNVCCSAPRAVHLIFVGAGISKAVLVILLLGNFPSMIYDVLVITGSLQGGVCVNVPVNQTIPSLGRACWGAEDAGELAGLANWGLSQSDSRELGWLPEQ